MLRKPDLPNDAPPAGLKLHLGILALFTVLVVAAAWPVVSQLDRVIVGDDNDIYINLWADWWTAKALQDPDLTIWASPYLFYPQGANLVFHSFSHLNTAVSLALRPLVGVLPAYNITILLNFVLIGLSMFQLARYLTGSTEAGIIAGLVFTFNSQTVYQSSHPVLLSMWCLPWLTLFLFRAVREKRPFFAAVASGFVVLGGAASTIMVILMGLWSAGLLLYFVWTGKIRLRDRRDWGLLSLYGVVSGGGVGLINHRLLTEAITTANDSFVTDPRDSILTDMGSIFVPHWLEWWERGLWLGIIPTVLALVLLVRLGRHREGIVWLVLTVVAYLFAIAPYPTWLGTPLDITLPWSIPVARLLRNMYRMMILFGFGWSMLAAYGWVALSRRLPLAAGRLPWVAVLLSAGVFIDFTAPVFPHRPAAVPDFYRTVLPELTQDGGVAILPTGRQSDKFYMYYQTIHEQPMTGGVISRATDTRRALAEIPLLAYAVENDSRVDFSRPDVTHQLGQLAALGVELLIIDKGQANDGLVAQWRDWLSFRPLYEDDAVVVYDTAPLIGDEFAVELPLADGVGFVSTAIAPADANQGGTIKINSRWGAAQPVSENLNVCWLLLPAAGPEEIPDPQRAVLQQCDPVAPSWPTGRWQANELVRDSAVVWLPADLPPNVYRLAAALHNGREVVGAVQPLAEITVRPVDPRTPSKVVWQEQIALLGFDHQIIPGGEALDLTLYWEGRGELARSAKLFVQLFDVVSGTIIAQTDVVPRGWTYPTNIWEDGEVVRESLQLPFEGVDSGRFELRLGWYDELTGERLPAQDPDTGQTTDVVTLVTVEVIEK